MTLQIHFILSDNQLISLNLCSTTTIETIKQILEIENNIDPNKYQLLHEQRPLIDSLNLKKSGVKNHDLIFVDPVYKDNNENTIITGEEQEKQKQKEKEKKKEKEKIEQEQKREEEKRKRLQKNKEIHSKDEKLLVEWLNEAHNLYFDLQSQPNKIKNVLGNQRQLIHALKSNQLDSFAQIYINIKLSRKAKEDQKQRFEYLSKNEPENPQLQKMIEEKIRMSRIRKNKDTAYRFNPELFVRVDMLYIPSIINDVPILAFVDTGAQTTIMSKAAAERVNILRLMDTDYRGVAVGVGTAKILGKVHITAMKIGSTFFNTSITILDQNGIEFIFGLDMIKRHQAMINMKTNRLEIANESIKFLSDQECLIFQTNPHVFLQKQELEKKEKEIIEISKKEFEENKMKIEIEKQTKIGKKIKNEKEKEKERGNEKERSNEIPITGGEKSDEELDVSNEEPIIDKIKTLMRMGFKEDDAFNALQQAKFDLRQAAVILSEK
ncbi:aspartyl protease ddi-related [Anaeramoeba flamelloides]|uniref:Aspartyl protease ddi-related n=1 Tax=Anaeramoeba flamelloides TaxID=1746091 RepID=A0AAV7Z520_9EUKA|nr:aspartyl protease ddi-related [Anaeramoeba flamelloides]